MKLLQHELLLSLIVLLFSVPAWAVSFTSVTPSGGILSQSESISVSTDVQVQEIQIIIDNNLYAAGPNTSSFSTSAANIGVGNHTLVAKAWFNNGQSILSNSYNITIQAAPAAVTPSFTSLSPGEGVLLQSGNIVATTNVQVQAIQIIVDNNLYATGNSTASFSTPAANISVGNHTLVAKAWFNNGQSVLSNSYNITVQSQPVTITPSFTTLTPAGGVLLQSGNIVATINVQVQAIQIILDNNLYATGNNTASFSTPAANISVGNHTLVAKAWFNNGQSILSNSYNINVQAPAVDPFAIPNGAWTSVPLDQCPLNTPNGTCGNSYWQQWADVNSNGTASGSLAQVIEDNLLSTLFAFTHVNYGDILNHLSTSYVNVNARNFVYDVWVKVQNVAGLQVLEFGVNHAIASGRVLFPGVQCNFVGDGHWDVNGFGPSPWTESTVPCNPALWEMQWHHIKLALAVSYGATAAGDLSYVNAIYDGILVNGVEQGNTSVINMQGGTQNFSYQPGLLTVKFQQGGAAGTLSSNTWLNNLKVSAW